jgi:hypothetical protein
MRGTVGRRPWGRVAWGRRTEAAAAACVPEGHVIALSLPSAQSHRFHAFVMPCSASVPCQKRHRRDYVIVYRCSLCLWFAIAGYVVTMWADVTNAHRSRASRTLWLGYVVTVSAYAILVPLVTIIAVSTDGDTDDTPLLAVPDVVRVAGEVRAVRCGATYPHHAAPPPLSLPHSAPPPRFPRGCTGRCVPCPCVTRCLALAGGGRGVGA